MGKPKGETMARKIVKRSKKERKAKRHSKRG
jgi:hypothetical protein